jgi:hypothetical protein
MSVVTLHRVYPHANLPMPADASALGTLPAAAFQYCEAMRMASSHGWYVFPPCDLSLKFDGHEVLSEDASGAWQPLKSLYFEDEFWAEWDKHAPESLQGARLAYAMPMFVPGFVQIWTGLLVSTTQNFSTLIRPLSNVYV